MFFEQLKKACEENNTTVTAVATKLNISKSNVTNWKNGTIPNGETVIRLSELLSVSTDYLLKGEEINSFIDVHSSNVGAVGHNISGTINVGNDKVTYQSTSNAKVSEDGHDEMTDELLRIFKTLPLKERTKIMTKVYEIEDEYVKKK